MKRNFVNQLLIASTFIVSNLVSSCSKDKSELPSANHQTSASNNSFTSSSANNDNTSRIGNWGSVTGTVFPRNTVMNITITNSDFTSDQYYFLKDGLFRLDHIPPGMYKLIITYHSGASVNVTSNPTPQDEVFEYVVTGVKVAAGMTYEIGNIVLP